MSSDHNHENDMHHEPVAVAAGPGGQFDSGLKSLVRSLQVAFFLLVVIIVAMLVYFFTFGGYFSVKSQEAVIVLRFGKYVGTFNESWHWFFPYPVHKFIHIPTNQQILSVSFEGSEASKGQVIAGEPPMGGPLLPGRDRYLITADANIVHSSWQIEYQVSNPRKYYEKCLCPPDPGQPDQLFKSKTGKVMGTRGPQTILQNLLRNSIIRVSSTLPITEILYENKKNYSDRVQLEFIKSLNALDLGIQVNNITLLSSQPPLKTKRAFDEVTAANQEKSILIDTANKYKVQQHNDALAKQATIVGEAESYRKRVVSEVQAEAIYFRKINEKYCESPETVLVSLYNNTLSDVLSQVDDKYIIGKRNNKKGKQEVRLKINPEPLTKSAEEQKNSSKEVGQ